MFLSSDADLSEQQRTCPATIKSRAIAGNISDAGSSSDYGGGGGIIIIIITYCLFFRAGMGWTV